MLGVLIETRFIEHRLDGRLRELEELVLKNSSKGGRKRVCCVLQRIETRVAEMRRSFERS